MAVGRDNLSLERERVECYSETRSIADMEVDIRVYSVYRCGGEDLDNEYHSIEYDFHSCPDGFRQQLSEFQEEVIISWYGEKIFPAFPDFGDSQHASLPVPNSLDERVDDKILVPELADNILDELEKFLEQG